jgi:carbon-monoxide dehydrogenase large subunit
VVKYSVVDDVGTVMNPLLLKGQIVGGVAMGVGQILKEDINFDAAASSPPARSWTTPCRAPTTSARSR